MGYTQAEGATFSFRNDAKITLLFDLFFLRHENPYVLAQPRCAVSIPRKRKSNGVELIETLFLSNLYKL